MNFQQRITDIQVNSMALGEAQRVAQSVTQAYTQGHADAKRAAAEVASEADREIDNLRYKITVLEAQRDEARRNGRIW